MLLLKVCGMRDTANITELIKLQPDFMGIIFHEKSPRNVLEIPSVEIPSSIKKVGVFVDKDIPNIIEKVKDFKLDGIQLHGSESPNFIKELLNNSLLEEGLREVSLIKAFNISEDFNFEQLQAYEPFCDYFLFDAFGKKAGGNGITFNWELLQKYNGQTPFLLSGGINGDMASKLKQIDHPKFVGVDINSGFEIKPALKDIDKIKKFKKELVK